MLLFLTQIPSRPYENTKFRIPLKQSIIRILLNEVVFYLLVIKKMIRSIMKLKV